MKKEQLRSGVAMKDYVPKNLDVKEDSVGDKEFLAVKVLPSFV